MDRQLGYAGGRRAFLRDMGPQERPFGRRGQAGRSAASVIVEQEVETAELLADLLEQGFDGRLVRNVGGDNQRFAGLRETSRFLQFRHAAAGQRNGITGIEQTKRALWALTSATRPERRKIDAMTRELDELTRLQQDEFMRAVTEAATLWRRRSEPR